MKRCRSRRPEGERARQWIDDLGRWLRELSGAWEHGPAPADRSTLGLVRELRVRDWMTADGRSTLAGRDALSRWLDAADR
jgi:hypothetical protein